MNLTTKQKQILGIIAAGNRDGTAIDLDELIDRVPYDPSKQSMQFSVRALMARGLIEKLATENRRGRARRVFQATPIGHHWASTVCPRPDPQNLQDVEELQLTADDLDLSPIDLE